MISPELSTPSINITPGNRIISGGHIDQATAQVTYPARLSPLFDLDHTVGFALGHTLNRLAITQLTMGETDAVGSRLFIGAWSDIKRFTHPLGYFASMIASRADCRESPGIRRDDVEGAITEVADMDFDGSVPFPLCLGRIVVPFARLVTRPESPEIVYRDRGGN